MFSSDKLIILQLPVESRLPKILEKIKSFWLDFMEVIKICYNFALAARLEAPVVG